MRPKQMEQNWNRAKIKDKGGGGKPPSIKEKFMSTKIKGFKSTSQHWLKRDRQSEKTIAKHKINYFKR